jgi:hypothetical protein
MFKTESRMKLSSNFAAGEVQLIHLTSISTPILQDFRARLLYNGRTSRTSAIGREMYTFGAIELKRIMPVLYE